ncbi:MAG TPA: geranylgeranyl reductase family protein, partial [Candidatus Poseidoniales archaeon]|nr:geranylgeranyl reductase family protein [Candidatus Poseidoniales archaeon]
MTDWDVVIVGAGPVGGYAAYKLAEMGHRILILEEHGEIGRPFQCAGLVTPEAMQRVGLEHTILSSVVGAKMHSPEGLEIAIGSVDKVRTHVVCRKLFDQGVVRLGLDNGATLWLNSTPTKVVFSDSGVELSIENNGIQRTVTSKLLIGADGAHSWVRRTCRMGKPREWMVGFQIEITGYEGEDEWLEMYTGRDIAPGLFAWVIPNGETHRIGMWALPDDLDGHSCEEFVDNLMNHPLWRHKFENCCETARYCGPIPAGMVRRPYGERVLLVGDAAGLAKPTTGGGIGPGFQQVDLLSEDLSSAISKDALSARKMKKICRPLEQMRREQQRSRALRDFFVTSRSDAELHQHFE